MSLLQVAENDVMEMDVTFPSDVTGVSYATVTSGTSPGTGWSWQDNGSAAASLEAASSGWTDWQADVQTDGNSDPQVKALPGCGEGKPEEPQRPGGS
eukprot:2108537-Amphidinium_carterae.1